MKQVHIFSKNYLWEIEYQADQSYRFLPIEVYKKSLEKDMYIGGFINHVINYLLRKRSKSKVSEVRNGFLKELFEVVQADNMWKGYVYSNPELEKRLKRVLMESYMQDHFENAKTIFESLFMCQVKIFCSSKV